MEQQSTARRVTIFDGLKPRDPAPRAAPPKEAAPLDEEARARRAMLLLRRRPVIEAVIEDLRPNLQRDGGDCQLVQIKGDAIYLRLTGTCVDCQLASLTISGVRQKMIEAVGFPIRVVPVD